MFKTRFLHFLLFILITNISFANDKILMSDGSIVEGEIVRFGNNRFIIETSSGRESIRNSLVNLVAVDQELSSAEKYMLGVLDGKRYAKNKGGNFAVGFFFSLLGTAIVYATSDQYPAMEASLGPNNALIDDANYIMGYNKGARAKSGGKALIGSLTWITLLQVAIASYY